MCKSGNLQLQVWRTHVRQTGACTYPDLRMGFHQIGLATCPIGVRIRQNATCYLHDFGAHAYAKLGLALIPFGVHTYTKLELQLTRLAYARTPNYTFQFIQVWGRCVSQSGACNLPGESGACK